MRKTSVWGLVAGLAAVSSACGSGSGDITASPSAASTSTVAGAATTAPPRSSRVAETLRFSAPTVGGGQLDGSSLAGRDVVLWFWAPW